MIINHRLRKKKMPLLYIIIAIVVAILISSALYIFFMHMTESPASNKSQNSQSHNSLEQTPQTNNTQDNTKDKNDYIGNNNVPLSVQIVSANVNDGIIHIGTLVNGTTNATCSLTATNSNQTIKLGTRSLQQSASADYDCGVFNIETSRLPRSGEWIISLTVITDKGSTAISTQEVKI